MSYKKCPICEINYIKEDEDICAVCAGQTIPSGRTPLMRKTNEPYYFMVYQSKNYNNEFSGGYIKAPTNTHNHHWERLLDLKIGDVIYHAVNGYIVAVSTVLTPAYVIKTPYEDYKECYRVDCKYKPLKKQLNLENYKQQIMIYGQNTYSPFNKNGTGNQGYLFVLSHELAKIFKDDFVF